MRYERWRYYPLTVITQNSPKYHNVACVYLSMFFIKYNALYIVHAPWCPIYTDVSILINGRGKYPYLVGCYFLISIDHTEQLYI